MVRHRVATFENRSPRNVGSVEAFERKEGNFFFLFIFLDCPSETHDLTAFETSRRKAWRSEQQTREVTSVFEFSSQVPAFLSDLGFHSLGMARKCHGLARHIPHKLATNN